MAIAAYGLWGIVPLYWPLLRPATALEIVAHRIVWSLGFFAALIIARRRLGALRAIGTRRLRLLALAACVVSMNWGVYIWAVNSGHIVETALGYFVNPLVTVLIGVLVLGESLSRARWISMGIVACGVLVLTFDYGRPPWIALALASTFAVYGLLKKQAGVAALEGMAIETAILFVPAMTCLGVLDSQGIRHPTTALIAASGVITGLPLLAFAGAANRIPLRTLGPLQYISPTLAFLIGVFIRHEPMPASRWLGFVIVWCALVLFVGDGLRRRT
jgi:chloramphenicol-sensitive protein RarD